MSPESLRDSIGKSLMTRMLAFQFWMNARVTVLGSGTSHGVPMIGCSCAVCTSADPRDRRSRPSIYVEVENGPKILVDTSTDLREQALRPRRACVSMRSCSRTATPIT